jgi:outer membrane protein TolC
MVVARAAMFPRLTLDAVLAHQNPGFQAALTTLEGPGNSLSLAAALTQTLFDGGKVRAQRAEVQARREELVAEYRKAILAALIDAQRALTVEQVLEHQQLEADEAERSTQKTEQALVARGNAGLGDRLVVIEARRAALTAQDENDHAYALRLKAAVGLFKALGGGWHNEAAQ